jgi:hypothetical protein
MLDLKSQSFLNQIKLSYGLNESVGDELLGSYFSCHAEHAFDLQVRLVEFVLNDEWLQRFPPSLKYRQGFLKKCIACLERSGIEVEDSFYETYMRLISGKQSPNETNNGRFFATFHSKVGQIFRIFQSK